jgi:hypothetical protein
MNAEGDCVASNGIVDVGEGVGEGVGTVVGVAVGAGVDWTGRVGTCAVGTSDGTGLERRMALGYLFGFVSGRINGCFAGSGGCCGGGGGETIVVVGKLPAGLGRAPG